MKIKKEERESTDLVDLKNFIDYNEKLEASNDTFQKLMFIYKMAIKEVNTKIEIFKDEFKMFYNYDLVDHVNTRIKAPKSIIQKMTKKECKLTYKDMIENINDIAGIRIVCPLQKDIYTIKNLLQNVPGIKTIKEKDYITKPKESGYSAYHLIVETPVTINGETVIIKVEIQIRTYKMHKHCEYGIAAHWMYKDGSEKMNKLDKKINWFRNIIENAQTMQSTDFVETLKTDLYTGSIFVQTPKGKVLEFPVGATMIDFAYSIHSDIGNHCVGGKINNIMKPIYTELKNGDVVEIITNSNSKGPSRDWLNHVKTSGARSRIKSFFKNEMKEENIANGKIMLEEASKARQFSIAQLLEEKYINDILIKYTMESMEELYASIGSGSLSATQVVGRLIALYLKDHDQSKNKGEKIKLKTSKSGVVVDGATGLLVRYAGCCHPIAGDDIIGYISQGKGVTIHRKDCPNLKYLDKERLIEVDWEGENRAEISAEIKVIAEKSATLLNKITSNLATENVSLRKFEAKEKLDQLEFTIVISAKSREAIKATCAHLEQINGIKKVNRIS